MPPTRKKDKERKSLPGQRKKRRTGAIRYARRRDKRKPHHFPAKQIGYGKLLQQKGLAHS